MPLESKMWCPLKSKRWCPLESKKWCPLERAHLIFSIKTILKFKWAHSNGHHLINSNGHHLFDLNGHHLVRFQWEPHFLHSSAHLKKNRRIIHFARAAYSQYWRYFCCCCYCHYSNHQSCGYEVFR